MNRPSPAIVSEAAVRRLPRVPLLLLCLVYVLAGFIGREPWKSADMTALGHMLELLGGSANWLAPGLFGTTDVQMALLPHWLGAAFIQAGPSWLSAAAASRIPFVLLLAGTLAATWYATYHLARRPEIQPVNFAFGGEAQPKDYARALADAALLAVLACLGLAQLSHETTPAVAQLSTGALAFMGMAALPFKPLKASLALVLGLAGLALSGAPTLALILGLVNLAFRALDQASERKQPQVIVATLACVLVVLVATTLDLWAWRLRPAQVISGETRSFMRLLLWFTWPAWPLALWTLWRWRRHLGTFPIGLPLVMVVIMLLSTYLAGGSDRSLLVALPALACLAAFALPTLQRGVSALIDWFTLLFFSGCALVIWLYWIAMETGSPRRMAASVSKLVPGFEPSLQVLPLLAAVVASMLWIALVRWRVGRHPRAIWKSLVLPATGATLCWVLLMTLWLPMLDFARSYQPLVRRVTSLIGQPSCVHTHGLTPGQISAFRYHGHLLLKPATRQAQCPWLLVDVEDRNTLAQAVDVDQWSLRGTFRRPSDKNEDVSLYQRKTAQP